MSNSTVSLFHAIFHMYVEEGLIFFFFLDLLTNVTRFVKTDHNCKTIILV